MVGVASNEVHMFCRRDCARGVFGELLDVRREGIAQKMVERPAITFLTGYV
jgi:hypothetical protein